MNADANRIALPRRFHHAVARQVRAHARDPPWARGLIETNSENAKYKGKANDLY